ncbi:hypothetical protein NHQ30_003593 [Ciborinia camelliae]|nr:hypothetical protein NHQ30_003593 [Ciborinia camelliae]
MAPASNEEQFKFLISCIRYSNNGKVDFGQVAKECKIVTKGAAAKRYERMMRSHGIAPNAASIKPAPGSSSASSSTPTSSARGKSSTGKKRKFSGDEENVDDEEESSNQSSSNKNRVKREVKGEMGAHAHVKEELYREDSPSAQLQEGLQMDLGAGLCDVNSELVGYYTGDSSVGGSVNGDASGLEYGDVEGFTAGGMNTSGMNSGVMNAYNQQQTGYTFDAGAYGGMMGGQGMMGNGNGMSGHGGQTIMTPRSHAVGSGGMGMGAQQYQSMGQGYENRGGSESPLLVE